MTDATPLASKQITQDADLLTRAKVRIAIGKQTGAHTANRLNIYQIAEELLAALSATPAPNGVVPLDEPNCTNDDYLRRKALTEMVAMDEQMEAEHPGWMTGEFTPAPSDQDASQAQGEVERFTQPYTERRGDDIFVTFDAPHDEVQPFILDVEHAAALRDQLSAALSPAPGATAQDGVAPPFDHAHNAALYGALAASQTPTIPAGMVAWNGGDSAPSNWDSAEPIMLATGHLFRAISMDGDLLWRHVRFRDGSLNSACIIAYTPLAAAPKQAEQQGVERMREALTKLSTCYKDWDPDAKFASSALATAQNIALEALSPAPGATAQDGEAWRNDPASLESGLPCPSSLDGRHQVDTSMESGPNNCFHCEAPMGGKA